MKPRLSLAFGIALLAAALAHGADVPSVKQRPVDTPHDILFVGNSYFYCNDSLHNHARRMVDAAGIATEKQLHYKSATIGGAALSDARRKSFHDKVVEFGADIAKAGGKSALYVTHAYVAPNKNASPDMIRKVEDMYVSVGNEVGAYVIPVGLAFEESYRRRPDLLLHKTYDGSHPNLYGTDLAACVVFASLYGKSPVGNTYDYYGAVDKASAAYLQQVAEDTVKELYGR